MVENVEAVKKAPTSRNVTELMSYLGFLSYYLLAFSSQPLNRDGAFILTVETQTILVLESITRKVFTKSKELLTSSCVILHFDPELDIIPAF